MTTTAITMLGLILDILGALYIAYEIFPFKGKKQVSPYGAAPRDTAEWEQHKKKHLKRGFILIIGGFLLQLIANGMSFFA
jgi:hypothetical protein